MLGNDISNQAAPLLLVMEDVVLTREATLPVQEPKKRWWRRKPQAPGDRMEERVFANLSAINILYRYSQRMSGTGLRIEILRVGDPARDEEILSLLSRYSGGCINGVLTWPDDERLMVELPYLHGVIGIVAEGTTGLRFGRLGMSLMDLER